MFKGIAAHLLSRRSTRFVALSLVTALVVTSLGGCAALDWIEKKTPPELPGEEQARLEAIKKRAGADPRGLPSPLQATPGAIDFADTIVGSETPQRIVLANPAGFAVTVVSLTIEGDGFIASGPPQFNIPAHGEVVLTTTFRPPKRGRYSGGVRIEIDSAGARLTQVPLRGRGIKQ